MADKTSIVRGEIQSFEQLLAERKGRASQARTKEEAARLEWQREVVHAAAGLTHEGIVRGVADLQLTLSRATEDLASTLMAEAARLEQVRQAIEVEAKRLNELTSIETAAKALEALIQGEQEKARSFEASSIQQRDLFEQEVMTRRASWQKEQDELQQANVEYAESLRKERELAEADYVYTLERQQKMEKDEYEAKRREQGLQIAELEGEKQRQWAEREQAMAERRQEIEEYRAQVAAFPQELEKAMREARERATQSALEEAQVEADLFAREIGANKRVRELKIQTLEATLSRQTAQIAALSADLKETLRRAQDLASKAVVSAATGDTSSVEPKQ